MEEQDRREIIVAVSHEISDSLSKYFTEMLMELRKQNIPALADNNWWLTVETIIGLFLANESLMLSKVYQLAGLPRTHMHIAKQTIGRISLCSIGSLQEVKLDS